MSAPATILRFPLPARQADRHHAQADPRHLEQLEYAEQMARYAADMIEIERDCAAQGARLMPTGAIISNRALHAALCVVVAVINLSGQRRRFRALSCACDLAIGEIERERAITGEDNR